MTDEASKEIDPAGLQQRLEAGGTQLIDVRADHEWDAGRIPGAVHIRLELLSEQAEEIDRERPVIFYCRGGNRSGMAVQAFSEAGYEASKLAGGITAWAEAALPLEPEGGYVAESGDAAAVLEARRRASDQGSAL